jgi:DNA-binding transcriptional LysR family regulator
MSLRFRQLQAFHAIIETGTVTGAAEALGISQPGVSNLIAQLERQTRLPLFRRDRGRLVPTPEASLLYREIDTVVRGLDHVAQAVNDLQNKQAGQLQVACPHALSIGFMPALIARFARDRPQMSVAFQSQYSAKIQEWIVSGLFEIGVCEQPLLYDSIAARGFAMEMFVAVPTAHPLAAEAELTPAMLDDVPFIVMGPEHMTHRRTREAFHAAGATWRAQVHTHLFQNVLSFVREGLGVGLIDRFTANFGPQDGYVLIPFRPLVTLDLALITSKSRPLSVLAEEFRDVLEAELESYAVEVATG